MGKYINPGNNSFKAIRKEEYVDKTGLISLINHTLGTKKKLTCVSRPRRFGKSYAMQMLCAYYDQSCDSRDLFRGLEIEKDAEFETYLNKYEVIYLDITWFISAVDDIKNTVKYMQQEVIKELKQMHPEVEEETESLPVMMANVNEISGEKYIVLIDEWDALFRETKADEVLQREYILLLRAMFKSSLTDKMIEAAYMTGILPIKKDGSQSAISDFNEFTMIKPRKFGAYVGFTEKEVQALCQNSDADFATMKEWYDGYFLRGVGSVYNPNSVMKAIENDDYDSYWTETSAAESLMEYISMDYLGLSKTIAELLGGIEVVVDTKGFANDLVTFRNRDDVLTLLIHLGYLAYNEETSTVHIPNEEIRLEFAKAVRAVKNDETIRRVKASEQLIYDTIHQNENAVAAQIEKIHLEETAPLFYNNEQALRSVIKLAYFSYKDYYIQVEELPSGHGFADVVYLPKKNSGFPALVVELKWNQTAEGAIAQIKDKKYPTAIENLGSDILLVGIDYDEKEKIHHCKIETVKK